MIPLPSYDDDSKESRERRERFLQLNRLLAEIEKRINSESKTRTRYVSSVTTEPAFRDYYYRLSKRIEDFGTKNFPKYGDSSLYGRVTVLLTVRKNGEVEDIEVTSAPSKILSTHAIWIVRELAPFDPFPPDVALEVDRIAVSAHFNFTKR